MVVFMLIIISVNNYNNNSSPRISNRRRTIKVTMNERFLTFRIIYIQFN